MTGSVSSQPAPQMPTGDRALWFERAAVLSVFVLLAVACFRRVWEGDFWWELALGRDLLLTGIPYTDTYSFTAHGGPWFELRWLYCLTIYGASLIGGIPGVMIFKWSVMVASFGFVTMAAVTRRTVTSAAVVLTVAILAASQRFFIRPELATFLFFSVGIWLIVRYRRGRGSAWAIWIMPLLQIPWINCHPLFFFGIALAALWLGVALFEVWLRAESGPRAGWSQVRTAALLLVANSATSFINAYGVAGVLWPIQLHRQISAGSYNEHITEYWSPFAFSDLHAVTYFLLLLAAMVLASCLLNWRRLDPFLLLLAAAQFYLACIAIRNQALFSLAAVPLFIANMRDARLDERPSIAPWLPPLRRTACLIVVVTCSGLSWDLATDRFYVRQGDTNQSGLGVARHRHPIEAVNFMQEHDVQGHVFSPMLAASYLFWSGYPVFIDGRIEVFGPEQIERFQALQTDRRVWNEVVRQYDVQVALIDLDFSVGQFLKDDPRWKLVYFDDSMSIHVKRKGPNDGIPEMTTEEIEATAARLWNELPRPKRLAELGWFERAFSPYHHLRLGKFLLVQGHFEAAERFLQASSAASPNGVEARQYLALLLQRRGDRLGAVREFEAVLRQQPDHAQAALHLGRHRLESGDAAEASRLLRLASLAQPKDPLIWALLAKALAQQNDYTGALEATHRAVELDPSHAAYAKNLGQLYVAQQDFAQAAHWFGEALRLDPNDASVYEPVARLQARAGDPAAALRIIRVGLQRHPQDPKLIELERQLLAALR